MGLSATASPEPRRLGAPLVALGLLMAGAWFLDVNAGFKQVLLLLLGAALGLTLYHAAFGFTSAWRVFINERRGAGLRAQMVMLALAVLLFFPALAAGNLFGNPVTGLVAPAGVSVVFGAFIFGIGMLPTGSKDPYALRRAALGVLRILIEKQLDLDLTGAVQFAVKQYGAKVKAAGLADQVLEFIFDRLRARYEDEGIDVATYLSVRALQPGSALDFDQRVQAVQAFRKLPEAEALAAVNKRVSNLLSKAEGAIAEQVEPKYFDNANEFSLYSAIQQADQAVQPMAAARQYSESLARLAALRDPVDAFFEAVMVNAEDAKVRANRYALLSRLRGLFLGVADISLLG
ncbi:MAG TPA: hypothetical protein DIT96_12830 [Pseudomonas sp.]|nr:hypothetical protein [Pseudomonas sp.]